MHTPVVVFVVPVHITPYQTKTVISDRKKAPSQSLMCGKTASQLLFIYHRTASPTVLPFPTYLISPVPQPRIHSHTVRQRHFSGSGQEMKVTAHESPGIDTKGLLITKILQTAKKIFTILLATEYLYPVNPPAHYMMQGTGCIKYRLSEHEMKVSHYDRLSSCFGTNAPLYVNGYN